MRGAGGVGRCHRVREVATIGSRCAGDVGCWHGVEAVATSRIVGDAGGVGSWPGAGNVGTSLLVRGAGSVGNRDILWLGGSLNPTFR